MNYDTVRKELELAKGIRLSQSDIWRLSELHGMGGAVLTSEWVKGGSGRPVQRELPPFSERIPRAKSCQCPERIRRVFKKHPRAQAVVAITDCRSANKLLKAYPGEIKSPSDLRQEKYRIEENLRVKKIAEETGFAEWIGRAVQMVDHDLEGKVFGEVFFIDGKQQLASTEALSRLNPPRTPKQCFAEGLFPDGSGWFYWCWSEGFGGGTENSRLVFHGRFGSRKEAVTACRESLCVARPGGAA